MKLIILDIDGVLVINYYINNLILNGKKTKDKFGSFFHPDSLNNLNEIIKETNAKIVVSSQWRLSGLNVMKRLFESRGILGEVIDITPILSEFPHTRDDEIRQWLETNGIPEKFVILDDMDIDEFPKSFFKINSRYGITDEIKNKIIKYLNS